MGGEKKRKKKENKKEKKIKKRKKKKRKKKKCHQHPSIVGYIAEKDFSLGVASIACCM